MSRVARVFLAGCLAVLPGCNSNYDNPFESSQLTADIPAGAAAIFSSNAYATRSGALHELYSVDPAGAGLTRLTFCNSADRQCDVVEAAPSPDRRRVAVRRISTDTNGDGRLTPADGEGLFMVDLTRGVEAGLLAPSSRVSGIDWSPIDDILVFSAVGGDGNEDIFRVDANGQTNRNLTESVGFGIRERRPRIDPTGQVAVYERIDTSLKGRIYIFSSSALQIPVTTGGPGTVSLAGTPYMVGSDADPDYSPDGGSIVFRRCTGVGTSNLGTWDILTVRIDGSNLRTIVSGPAFRGAPDWGTRGIIFSEVDATGRPQLVVVDADGANRRTPVTLGAGFDIAYPRWLP